MKISVTALISNHNKPSQHMFYGNPLIEKVEDLSFKIGKEIMTHNKSIFSCPIGNSQDFRFTRESQ